ncbi:MAG: hypothetical protein VKO21_06605 [Candidatus Sericytochromatia bacterium]|nr:hypothetical protein [Candidatus Sericytochromatia bacterium]
MSRSLALPVLAALAVAGMVGCGGIDTGTVTYGNTYDSDFGQTTNYPSTQPLAYPTPFVDPYASAYPGAPFATASALPVVPTPAPTAVPVLTPVPVASPASSFPSAYGLRILDLHKSSSGVMWFRRASVTLQIHNPLFVAPQVGKLQVLWYFEGQVVGTPKEVPLQLEPAEIRSYTFKADVRSDDVVVKLSL